jgi:hypothetical protein
MRNNFGKKLDQLRDDLTAGFIKNDCEALEKKLVLRMNEVTIALTRELADRRETKKNFRLVDRQLKNMFSIVLQSVKNIGLVPISVIIEA